MSERGLELELDRAVVREARRLARRAAAPVIRLAKTHTTVAIERAVLRLGGVVGADRDGIPHVNRLVDAVAGSVGLERGAALPVWDALVNGPYDDLAALARAVGGRQAPTFRAVSGADARRARAAALRAVRGGLRTIARQRTLRERLIRRLRSAKPWVYLIVATGDIFEDVEQAKAAARGGADVIAVIRSTGQSLLDYVPEGATREGYGGTYATQENFRLMRAALDDVSRELGRYVRLTNYASGLCMPEIAVLAGFERLDMMLNDSMYGIIFRDINPQRTFVDQRFARRLHAHAGIVINTGEDNYLTTDDAVDGAHTVIASQLLNEAFAKDAALEDWQIGLGHAFEIDPAVPGSLRLELAHAALVRALFPKAPLKYMPPTKHMTGNIFAGYLLDGFFNLVALLTRQEIVLVGMMSEGIHTPSLADRELALENLAYVRTATAALDGDLVLARDGFVVERAHTVLHEAVDLLRQIADESLLQAIAHGRFASTKRPPDSGRGADGVVRRAPDYFDPVSELLDPAT